MKSFITHHARLFSLLFLGVAATITPSLYSQDHAHKWCVVGGTRGVGYAFIQELSKTNTPCTVLVRSDKKAQKLFQNNQNVSILQGEASSPQDIMRAAAQCTHILLAQSFPYDDSWEPNTRAMMRGGIEAAKSHSATLIYPGRIFPFGTQTPIKEDTQVQPVSHQGRVLAEVEEQLIQAAHAGECVGHVIRHGYPFGPSSGDGLMDQNFKEVPKNATRSWWSSNADFKWLGSDNLAVYLAYTPDVARFALTYLNNTKETASTVNCPGYVQDTIIEFSNQLCQQAGVTACTIDLQKSSISVGATFGSKAAKRAADVMESFNHPILLDTSYAMSVCPDFVVTPLTHAINETIAWYKSA